MERQLSFTADSGSPYVTKADLEGFGRQFVTKAEFREEFRKGLADLKVELLQAIRDGITA